MFKWSYLFLIGCFVGFFGFEWVLFFFVVWVCFVGWFWWLVLGLFLVMLFLFFLVFFIFLGFLGFFGFKGWVFNFDLGSWLVGLNFVKFIWGSKVCVKCLIVNNFGVLMVFIKEIVLLILFVWFVWLIWCM